VVTFASSVNRVALDFSKGSTLLLLHNPTITLQAFDGVTLLGSTSVVLGPINAWSTLSLAFPEGFTLPGVRRPTISASKLRPCPSRVAEDY
jgi:hypothetical protein